MANHKLTPALAVLIALFGALRIDAPKMSDASQSKKAYSILASDSMPWAPVRIVGHKDGKQNDSLVGKRQFDATVVLAGVGLRHCSQGASLNGAVVTSGGLLSPYSLHVKLQV
jgi:hypothetical protein